MTSSTERARLAFGKIILLGEHAVVYGQPAIAGALDRGVRCVASPAQQSRLVVPDWQLDIAASEDNLVAEALRVLIERTASPATLLEARADLPASAGLGSSAALCVAIARALEPDAGDERIAEVANAGETCFHGSPSGIDVALSLGGGLGVFRKGQGLSPLAAPAVPVVVALSGQDRQTSAMVARVAERVAASPAAMDRIERMGALALAATPLLLAGDLEALAPLMNECQDHLRSLGVSTDRLDQMIDTAHRAGALACKLTGAGGGGAVIALAPGREEQVLAAFQAQGYAAFQAQVGGNP